jgi:transcriptional antiterminator|tara:strand:- start:1483 stop:1887 length:405 start_codon:yes stop_codon:yes gene_type:complete
MSKEKQISSAKKAANQLRFEGIDAEYISSEGGVCVNVWTVDLSDTIWLRIHDEDIEHLAREYDKRKDANAKYKRSEGNDITITRPGDQLKLITRLVDLLAQNSMDTSSLFGKPLDDFDYEIIKQSIEDFEKAGK